MSSPDDIDDDEPTPVDTPAAKRSSAEHKIGNVPCPKCKGTKLLCDLCKELGTVTLTEAMNWHRREANK